MNHFHHPRRRVLLLGALTASVLAACGGSDDDSLDDRADVADPKIRFVHAVPGGPNVTLERNGNDESGVTDVPYKFGSQYYDVDTENYTFTLRTASGDVELASTQFSPTRGNRYTLLALPTDSGVELLVLRDPYNKSVTSDDARLRVVNAAVNAQSFDVYVTRANDDLNVETADLSDVGYKEAAPDSGDDSIDVEGGDYRIRLTPSGSKTPFFDASVTVPEDGDWLLVVLPESAAADDVMVLLVRSDDSSDATDEISG